MLRCMAALRLLAALGLVGAAGGCSCSEPKWCKPLSTPPSDHEIFPFVIPGSTPGVKDNVTDDWFTTFRWGKCSRSLGVFFRKSQRRGCTALPSRPSL